MMLVILLLELQLFNVLKKIRKKLFGIVMQERIKSLSYLIQINYM